nr:transposase [uncultured Porphyromonas sp.]
MFNSWGRLAISGGRCRYRGLDRTHIQNILEAMAYNLKRMPGLLVLQSTK